MGSIGSGWVGIGILDLLGGFEEDEEEIIKEGVGYVLRVVGI